MPVTYFSGLEWIAFNHMPLCRGFYRSGVVDHYALSYIHEGEVTWQYQDQAPVVLRGPAAWFRAPETRIAFGRPDRQSWNHRFVTFRGLRARRFISEGLVPPGSENPFIRITDPRGFADSFDRLLSYLGKPDRGPARAVHMLEGLLLQLQEQPESATGITLFPQIRTFMTRLEQHPEKSWDVEEYTRSIGISPFHFRRAFRKVAGRPPQKYLIHLRLEKASEWLRHPYLPVKVIARRVGYDDVYHFTKLFKKQYGLPPARFRRKAQLK